jgi:hypothetical protein
LNGIESPITTIEIGPSGIESSVAPAATAGRKVRAPAIVVAIATRMVRWLVFIADPFVRVMTRTGWLTCSTLMATDTAADVVAISRGYLAH